MRKEFNSISSELLVTEFMAVQEQRKELEAREKVLRDEVVARVEAGLDVSNDKAVAVLSDVEYRKYNVDEVVKVARKHKLALSGLLSASVGAIRKLPEDVQEKLPFVVSTRPRLNLKIRK